MMSGSSMSLKLSRELQLGSAPGFAGINLHVTCYYWYMFNSKLLYASVGGHHLPRKTIMKPKCARMLKIFPLLSKDEQIITTTGVLKTIPHIFLIPKNSPAMSRWIGFQL